MKGNAKNEDLINDLGGRRHLMSNGVSAIHCNRDGSITIIFEGYGRVSILKNDKGNYNIIRPSTVYDRGIGIFNNITLFEAYDVITRECNLSLWPQNNKSNGQLFAEFIIERLGGMDYIKKAYSIKNIKYLTNIEKLEFNLNNNSGITIYFEILKYENNNFTINKKMNIAGFTNKESFNDICEEDLFEKFQMIILNEHIVKTKYSSTSYFL